MVSGTGSTGFCLRSCTRRVRSIGRAWPWTLLVSPRRTRQKRGASVGPNPTDRGKQGTKRSVATENKHGLPLAVIQAGANIPDCKLLERTVDAIPALPGRRGRPRQKPGKVHADKGYDYAFCREILWVRYITPRIARRGIESKDRLGRYRWKVERTSAWFNRFRRLKIRYEQRDDIHQGFIDLSSNLICWNHCQRLLPEYRFC